MEQHPSIAQIMGFDQSNYIHPTCVIFPGVRMGSGNYFGPGCVIGAPAEHKGRWDARAGGRLIIGDQNTFTGHVTIDGAVKGQNEDIDPSNAQNHAFTLIGNECFFMKHTHVGHDARVANNVTVAVGAVIGGHAYICAGANLGVNSFIHQRQIIADYCMIGAGAVVDRNLETVPFCTYVGVPAKAIGPNHHEAKKYAPFQIIQIRSEFMNNRPRYLTATGQ